MVLSEKQKILKDFLIKLSDDKIRITKKQLDNHINELQIILPSSYNGKTPKNSLAKDLQTLRNINHLKFNGDGNYEILYNEDQECEIKIICEKEELMIKEKAHRCKTKELKIKNVLIKYDIPILSHDKIIKSGKHKYRPDFIFDYISYIIILEVDENQHKRNNSIDEQKRMIEIYQDFEGSPILFIRYNPDKYVDNKGKTIKDDNNEREIKLIDVLKNFNYDIRKIQLSVIHLFYDDFDGCVITTSIDCENNNNTKDVVDNNYIGNNILENYL